VHSYLLKINRTTVGRIGPKFSKNVVGTHIYFCLVHSRSTKTIYSGDNLIASSCAVRSIERKDSDFGGHSIRKHTERKKQNARNSYKKFFFHRIDKYNVLIINLLGNSKDSSRYKKVTDEV
jgi:hypothetical protein